MHFKKYILFYTLIPLLIITTATTYYRFFIIHDYKVSYEGECDPYESSCFVGCEDLDSSFNECSSEYFFTKIERNASDLVKLCPDGIDSCEFSNSCSPLENECKVTFCNSTDGSGVCSGFKQDDYRI